MSVQIKPIGLIGRIKPIGLILHFVLPMPENLTNRTGKNRSRHWRVLHREKCAYWEACDLIAASRFPVRHSDGIEFYAPPLPQQPFAKATITSRMYLGGAMDDVNAMARHKVIEDWLKTRGYIVDDRKKCLTWAGFPEQIVRRDGNYRIEITLASVA